MRPQAHTLKTTIELEQTTFRRFARRYTQTYGKVGLCAITTEGQILYTYGRWKFDQSETWQQTRLFALSEALRWGEATVVSGPEDHFLWAVPLMRNSHTLGALVGGISEKRLFPTGLDKPSTDTRAACIGLRTIAEQMNLTNASFLYQQRTQSHEEHQRAEVIHLLKLSPQYDLRQIYLREEPDLVAAVRKGNRGEARNILNCILVSMMYHAGDHFDLTKSFFMELVATVTRTAVEAGGSPSELLGDNFAFISELAGIQTNEQLAPWLHKVLERIIDGIEKHRQDSQTVLLIDAITYMKQHLGEPLTRDAVAEVANMSPSHFSRTFHRQTGRSFTQMLSRMRVNQASEMLSQTSESVGRIAMVCGFGDQSYFTKVFRRYTHLSPRQYRLQYQSPHSAAM